MYFGSVLGAFWDPKILDFRIFFDDFSKQILEDVFEDKKSKKRANKDHRAVDLGSARRNVRTRGRDREGVIRTLGLDF